MLAALGLDVFDNPSGLARRRFGCAHAPLTSTLAHAQDTARHRCAVDALWTPPQKLHQRFGAELGKELRLAQTEHAAERALPDVSQFRREAKSYAQPRRSQAVTPPVARTRFPVSHPRGNAKVRPWTWPAGDHLLEPRGPRSIPRVARAPNQPLSRSLVAAASIATCSSPLTCLPRPNPVPIPKRTTPVCSQRPRPLPA